MAIVILDPVSGKSVIIHLPPPEEERRHERPAA